MATGDCSIGGVEEDAAREMEEPILDRESFLIPFFKLFNLLKGDVFTLAVCCEGCVLSEARRLRKVVRAGVGGSIEGNERSLESNSISEDSEVNPFGTTKVCKS